MSPNSVFDVPMIPESIISTKPAKTWQEYDAQMIAVIERGNRRFARNAVLPLGNPKKSNKGSRRFKARLPLLQGYQRDVVEQKDSFRVAEYLEECAPSKEGDSVKTVKISMEIISQLGQLGDLPLTDPHALVGVPFTEERKRMIEEWFCVVKRESKNDEVPEIDDDAKPKSAASDSERDVVDKAVIEEKERNVIVHADPTILILVKPYVAPSPAETLEKMVKDESSQLKLSPIQSSSVWFNQAFDESIEVLEVVEGACAEVEEETPRKKNKGVLRRAARKIRNWLK